MFENSNVYTSEKHNKYLQLYTRRNSIACVKYRHLFRPLVRIRLSFFGLSKLTEKGCAWSRRKCNLSFLVKSLSASKNIKFISHMPWKWLMTDRYECNKSCPWCAREFFFPVEKEEKNPRRARPKLLSIIYSCRMIYDSRRAAPLKGTDKSLLLRQGLIYCASSVLCPDTRDRSSGAQIKLRTFYKRPILLSASCCWVAVMSNRVRTSTRHLLTSINHYQIYVPILNQRCIFDSFWTRQIFN